MYLVYSSELERLRSSELKRLYFENYSVYFVPKIIYACTFQSI
jgi:hypothetical protein